MMIVRRRVRAIGAVMLAGGALSATAPVTAALLETKQLTLSYGEIGDIRWTFPADFEYDVRGFERTVDSDIPGNRIACSVMGSERCELAVYSATLTGTDADRTEQLRVALLPETLDAASREIRFETYGGINPVRFATLEAKNPKADFRYLTYGYYSKPPFIVWFRHLSNDSTHTQRTRILEIVHSVASLDAPAVLALQVRQYAAICAARSTAHQAAIKAALSTSPLSGVNVYPFLRKQLQIDGSDTEMGAMLEKRIREFVESSADAQSRDVEYLCSTLPEIIGNIGPTL